MGRGGENNALRHTLAMMFSREVVRELRALFLRISSLKRLLVVVPSPADELFAAFCQMITMDRRKNKPTQKEL